MKKTGKQMPQRQNCEKEEERRGFAWFFTSPTTVVKLLCRPADPANLAVLRIAFGILMMIDIPQERGMSYADIRWGNQDLCRFPLFNSLHVPPLEWMYAIYLGMFIGAFGIMLGLFYRFSCLLFATTYWYIFILDKTAWNNHSYLYGLISILLLVVNGNRYWSVDGLLWPSIRNAHVPMWNYVLLRTQIFLVYFIAGLKKMDMDWVTGYSMQRLSRKWVFDPFRFLLTDDQIDLYIVHIGGLTIDFFSGILLLFDKTRPVAVFFLSSFHLMNSQMFSIGMFPYAMLATMPLFYSVDWPKRVFQNLPGIFKFSFLQDCEVHPSLHCVYNKEDVKPDGKNLPDGEKASPLNSKSPPPTSPSLIHKMGSLFTVLYISLQIFLPYSHGITKGYNNWTNGLYGYSWDMMVHSWTTQHIRLSYRDKITGKEGFLDPQAFVEGKNRRWSSHGDMVVQYAQCVASYLQKYNMSVELYLDVWKSMNKRFQQRMFDPRVNIVDAEWSPFKKVSFSMPLLVDLSPWRQKLEEMEKELSESSNYTDVVFVADFPGLNLEAYIQEELGNTSVTLLSGNVIVEFVNQKKNFTIHVGEKIQLPPGEFHKIHTVSENPSCYMYIYVNTTYVELMNKVEQVEKLLNETDVDADAAVNSVMPDNNALSDDLRQELEKRKQEKKYMSPMEQFHAFISKKFHVFYRSMKFTIGALESIILKTSFQEFLNRTHLEEAEIEFKTNYVEQMS